MDLLESPSDDFGFDFAFGENVEERAANLNPSSSLAIVVSLPDCRVLRPRAAQRVGWVSALSFPLAFARRRSYT